MSHDIELTLIGKPGCHLCEEAALVVNEVLEEFEEDIPLESLNILNDQALFAKYSDEIPVLLINGAVHNFWRIDPERLRAALKRALG